MAERLRWTRELVDRFWNEQTQTRLTELSFGKLAGPNVLSAVRWHLTPGQRHLDFGAGDGHFVRLLAESGFPAAAFEPSEVRRETLHRLLNGVDGFLGSVGADSAEQFDALFMLEVVEHVLDDELDAAFTTVNRLLKSDGLLVVSTPNREDLDLNMAIDPVSGRLFHRWQHLRSFTPETLTELLRGFGFEPLVVHEIEFSDRIFAAYGAGLGVRREYANLFNTMRPLRVGAANNILFIGARTDSIAARRKLANVDDPWFRKPFVLRDVTELQVPETPLPRLRKSGGLQIAGPVGGPVKKKFLDPARMRTRIKEKFLVPAMTRRRVKERLLDPASMQHVGGHCWTVRLSGFPRGASTVTGGQSTLELFEEHLPLGPRHSNQATIAERGRGLFSHWGNRLYFSSSDNSSPRENGWRYVVRMRKSQTAMGSITEQHATEVQHGQRFEFGKNWQRFLSTLTPERIDLAEQSLRRFLETDRLDGLTFLDIGSGSGLFSLAARRLGARVRSFDYDPRSVACTTELRRRYYPDDGDLWTIEQGSVLDQDFLGSLGKFDIVYSWGVLHHTGAMWRALDNVKPLVKVGGKLFIAIYNDLGAVTDMWWRIKRIYNALPAPFRLPYALSIIAPNEARTFMGHLRRLDFGGYLRTWSDYQRLSTRGMNHWHDWIDWIGGFPYERASIDEIVDVFAKDGFALTALEERSGGYGCNEFVFRCEAPIGTLLNLNRPVPGSRSFARRFGWRVAGPFRKDADGWVGRLPDAVSASASPGNAILLFRDDRFAGEVTVHRGNAEILVDAANVPLDAVERTSYRVVIGKSEQAARPFRRWRGMWSISVPHLKSMADDKRRDSSVHSRVFLFEDGMPLGFPQSQHAHIARRGRGRFSHWGDAVYFAASDNTNPNDNGRTYMVLYPTA